MSIHHKKLFGAYEVHCLLNLILTEWQLFDGVAYYLKHTFCQHGIAWLVQVISAAIEDIKQPLFWLVLAINIETMHLHVFANETYQEHKFKNLNTDVFLVSTFGEHSEQVLSIELPSLKEHFDQL